MIKNALLVMLSIIFLVAAGSLTYVFYYNTKAQIAEDKERLMIERAMEEEKQVKEKPKTLKQQMEEQSKEREKALRAKLEEEARASEASAEAESKPNTAKYANQDVAHLVEDMYITPLSQNVRVYEFEEHTEDAGIFLHPYVIENQGASSTLQLKAGVRDNAQINFNAIIIKCDSGEKQLTFSGSPSVANNSGLVVSFYDTAAVGNTESVMRAISGCNYVQVSIAGHEEENKILSPAEIKHFKNMIALYDALKSGN